MMNSNKQEAAANAKPSLNARIARALRCFSLLPGWGRLVNMAVSSQSAKFTIRNGETMFYGDIGSFIDRQIYLFGGYEAEFIETFLSMIPVHRRGTILDIGANVGNHSLAFGQIFDAVHSFEPNPQLWSQFERNVKLNALQNIHLHMVGLADHDDELVLHMIDKPNMGLGTFSTIEQYDLPLKAIATCPVRHAGRYLSKLGINSVDALKIDVQGFEPEVLIGLNEVLRQCRPIVWCEIGTGTRIKMGTLDELAQLIPFEFTCFKFEARSVLHPWRPKLTACKGTLDRGDYLVVPK